MALKASNTCHQNQKLLLSRFTSFLGANHVKGKNKKGYIIHSNEGCLASLFSTDCDVSCSVPSLMLASVSSKDTDAHFHEGEKTKVEDHAIQNLSRPMATSIRDKNDDFCDLPIHRGENQVTISQIPSRMLEHLADSFLLLTSARLRAFVNILARHGINLSSCPALTESERQEGVFAVDRKLEALLAVGSGLSVENMVINYHPVSHSTDENSCVPIVMETIMDISIPKLCGTHQIVTVTISVMGSLSVVFDTAGTCLTSVKMSIDTRELLTQLIDRASLAISTALDIVKDVCALPPRFSLPNIVPQHGKLVDSDLLPSNRELSPKFVPHVIISPEMEPKNTEMHISHFELDESISNLSPESCANIVDFVIGEVDHLIFPPLKRHKSRD